MLDWCRRPISDRRIELLRRSLQKITLKEFILREISLSAAVMFGTRQRNHGVGHKHGVNEG